MKNSLFLKVLGFGVLIANVHASSLYDVTPRVGLIESTPMQWSFSLSAGYDDNVNTVPRGSSRYESSSFVGFSVNTQYSDQDSRTQLTYSAQLGGNAYTRNVRNSSDQVVSNSNLAMTLTHAFDSTLRYTMSNSLAYTPDPNYADGISAARRQGNTFSYNTNHSIGKSLDPRWASTTTAGYSGILYSEGEYKDDNREYVNVSETFSFKESERTSYNVSARGQFVLRQEGYDNQSIYTTVGIQHALSPVSNFSLNVGTQLKFQSHFDNKLYPTLSGGYNRTVSDSTTINFFVSYDNESVGTYYSGLNYGSNSTWRMGVTCTHRLTHVLSVNCGVSAMFSDYSMGQGSLNDRKDTTYNLNAGCTYRLGKNLSLNMNYAYTRADLGNSIAPYYRNVYTIGSTYTF